MTKLAGITVAFFVLALAFGALERLFPAIRGKRLLRQGFRTDLAYWLFTPLVTKALTRAAVVLAVLGVAMVSGVPLEKAALEAFVSSRTAISRQPAWLQAIEVLLLADLLSYWSHRLFHRSPRLWPIHAVHHSSTELDWLSSVRVHPLNDAVNKVLPVVPLFFIGFRGDVLAGFVPFITLYALLLHANVPWSFGPLKYVIASPTFHRWHHAAEAEAIDKNFAGLFPVWDLVFGTFYMPAGRVPERFGVPDTPVPDGLLRQLVYPFRRERATPA